MRVCFLILIILITASACQTTLGGDENPTRSPTPQPVRTLRPTQTPRAIATWTLAPSPTSAPSSTPQPTIFFEPTGAPVTEAAFQPLSNLTTQVVGQSTEGRDIVAYRFGAGAHILLLVGGIHTGYETNTVTLVNDLIDHFRDVPADVLPGMSIVLIPVANPDGLTRGRDATGRFNANGVDLNRNWGCDWSPDAYWRNRRVDPGVHAFSEAETQALAQFVRQLRPSAVIFYHSAARGVFAGSCDGDHGSQALAAIYGEASGYPYGADFTAYPVSGTEANWIDGQGIPAVDLELTTTQSSEFTRNLNGVMAVQCWLTTGNGEC